jgi:hypothetical protein
MLSLNASKGSSERAAGVAGAVVAYAAFALRRRLRGFAVSTSPAPDSKNSSTLSMNRPRRFSLSGGRSARLILNQSTSHAGSGLPPVSSPLIKTTPSLVTIRRRILVPGRDALRIFSIGANV